MSAPLHVLLGADALRGRRTGIGRYTHEIAAQLLADPRIASLLLLEGGRVRAAAEADFAEPGPDPASGPAADFPDLRALLGRAAPLRALRNGLRRRALAHRIAATGRPFLYHETNLVPAPCDAPVTITVHDLFWLVSPDLLPRERLRWLERNWPRTVREARGFACVSAFTASELRRFASIGDRPVAVVPGAASGRFRPLSALGAAPVLGRYGLSDRAYVLALSTLEPRKNLERLHAAHRSLPAALRTRCPLVLAGAPGWGTSAATAEAAGRAGEVRLLGFVPDADLPALMARAALVAMVSLYEGYGLPVIEAMAAGTPVLHAATTATGETAGTAGVAVDPLDIDAIRDGLHRLIEDEGLRDRCREAGLRRAADFSWEAAIHALFGLWRDVLAE